MNYAKATSLLLDDLEGRSYSIDPTPTYSGVTQEDSLAYFGVDDPRNLTDTQISETYRIHYWQVMGCDRMPNGLDYAVFQAGVNCGTGTAIKWLQAILRVGVDGGFGPETQGALPKDKTGIDKVIAEFLATQDAYYDMITRENPNNEQYLEGWHNRVDKVRDAVFGSVGETIGLSALGLGVGVGIFVLVLMVKK